jgi:hypothetical protein
VRITIAHTHSKEQITQAIDRSFNDLFRGIAPIPVQFVEERRTWQGSTLTFSLYAKMGLLRTPIKGMIDVTEKDVTIDVDLGLFERLITATKVRESITNHIRGLLT